MARYDKYEPKAGGFRATLAADYDEDDVDKIVGVGLDVDGKLVVGEGTSGIKGVLILTKALKAGAVVDVMTHGQVVEFGPTDGDPGVDFGDPATSYYAGRDGAISDTASGVYVGHTLEGSRLTVRVEVAPSGAGAGVTWADVLPEGGIPLSDLDTTGTPSASNYLRGDGSWGTVGG